jgi:hypothetical protein
MVRRFGERGYVGREARAQQIYQILVSAAHNRQILTYKLLAKMVGYGGSGIFGDMLGCIACWCDQNKMPPLTCLVVNEKTGLSGEGIPIKKAHKHREKVYAFDWFAVVPPTREDLRRAYETG